MNLNLSCSNAPALEHTSLTLRCQQAINDRYDKKGESVKAKEGILHFVPKAVYAFRRYGFADFAASG